MASGSGTWAERTSQSIHGGRREDRGPAGGQICGCASAAGRSTGCPGAKESAA
jgi:hypothetical protein